MKEVFIKTVLACYIIELVLKYVQYKNALPDGIKLYDWYTINYVYVAKSCSFATVES